MCGIFSAYRYANVSRENFRFTGFRSIKHLTEKPNKSRRVTGSRGGRIDAYRFDRISEEETRSVPGRKGDGTRVEDERGYIMAYEGLSTGAPAENPGVEPVEYLWRPRRLLFLFGTRNRACGELAWNPKNIPPLFRFISGLSELPLSAPSGSFYSANPTRFPLCRAFSHDPTYGFFSLGEKRRRFSCNEEGRSLLSSRSLWTSPAKHANVRWHEILSVSGIPDFNKGNRSAHVWSLLRFFCLPPILTSGCEKYDLYFILYTFRESQVWRKVKNCRDFR